jgi:hypothetical protein
MAAKIAVSRGRERNAAQRERSRERIDKIKEAILRRRKLRD